MLEYFLIALSLCADCFVVSLCAGAGMRSRGIWSMVRTALAISFIHIVFLTGGWLAGSLVYGLVSGFAQWIGAALLFLVGGVMFVEGIRGGGEEPGLAAKLCLGFWGTVLAGVATSIDAIAVGAAEAVTGETAGGIAALAATLFTVTVAVVLSGLLGGRAIGRRFGDWAQVAGGLVLAAIGVGFVI